MTDSPVFNFCILFAGIALFAAAVFWPRILRVFKRAEPDIAQLAKSYGGE